MEGQKRVWAVPCPIWSSSSDCWIKTVSRLTNEDTSSSSEKVLLRKYKAYICIRTSEMICESNASNATVHKQSLSYVYQYTFSPCQLIADLTCWIFHFSKTFCWCLTISGNSLCILLQDTLTLIQTSDCFGCVRQIFFNECCLHWC